MPDQSYDQVNGRSLVTTFARCELRLNTVMIFQERRRHAPVDFDGAVLCTEFREAVKTKSR